MRKIVILGCNGGVDNHYGGGSFVISAMAHCLERRGYTVHMVSVIGLEKENLRSIHGFNLGDNVHSHFLINAELNPKLPYFLSLKMVNNLLNIIENISPDIVIYNDDIPKSIQRKLNTQISTILYIHFSYLIRTKIFKYDMRAVQWNLPEKILNFMILPYLVDNLISADVIVANSIATKKCTEKIGNLDGIQVLNPPIITTKSYPKNRNNTEIILHAARQDDTFFEDELCYFVKLLEDYKDLKIVINNNRSDQIYKMAKNQSNLYAFKHLAIEKWHYILDNVKYYLHFKWFEGFGIATAEAVLKGAIPFVYKSPFNGSWTDIASINELCSFIDTETVYNNFTLLESDDSLKRQIEKTLKNRVSNFDINTFDLKLNNIVNNI
jgi:hypothetical protein